MATRQADAVQPTTAPTGTAAVDAFLQALKHPLSPALALVRTTILSASPKIEEGIKWNSPSFCEKASGTWFATINTY